MIAHSNCEEKRSTMLKRSKSLRSILLFLGLYQIYVSAFSIQGRKVRREPSAAICQRVPFALSSTIETAIDGSNNFISNHDNAEKVLTFSIVPASTNPCNKFTKQLLEDVLPTQLNATDTRLLDESNGGRLTFSVQAVPEQSDSTMILDGSKWSQILSPYGVKSLRLVVCECEIPATLEEKESRNCKPSPLPADRQDFILETLEAHLSGEELPWRIYREIFGNIPQDPPSEENQLGQLTNLEVSCRRWASSTSMSKSEFSSTNMKHALKRILLQKYHCNPKSPQGLNDCEFNLLLYQNKLRLEWTVLVPPKSKRFSEADYLPKPGCKRVEAWMLMKNLEEKVIKEVMERNQRNENASNEQDVIVLDPLCGKATFLVEAATTWNTMPNSSVSISFVGVDASEDQLQDAKMNIDAVSDTNKTNDDDSVEKLQEQKSKKNCILVKRLRSHDRTSTLSLYKGDSRDLSLFKDGSVSAIATCPPFGRQFFALEKESGNSPDSNPEDVLATSYREWLREWTRILDPNHGRIALLVDVEHQQEALDAVASTGALDVTVLREPFRLGRVKATVIVADALPQEKRKVAIRNSGKEWISMKPHSRFLWEGTSKEARAEWTRLRAASLQGLEPYTKVQQQK